MKIKYSILTVCMIVVIAMKWTKMHEKQPFFKLQIVFFLIWEKKRTLWIGNGAEYRTLGIGRKGPEEEYCLSFFVSKALVQADAGVRLSSAGISTKPCNILNICHHSQL